MASGSHKPKHAINEENLRIGQTRGADCAIGEHDEMHQGYSLFAVVVLQQLLSRSIRAPFGDTGCLAQRFVQSDDLPQRSLFDLLQVAFGIETRTNLMGWHTQSWR